LPSPPNLQALHLLPIRRQLRLGALALGVLQLQPLLDLRLLRHVLPTSSCGWEEDPRNWENRGFTNENNGNYEFHQQE